MTFRIGNQPRTVGGTTGEVRTDAKVEPKAVERQPTATATATGFEARRARRPTEEPQSSGVTFQRGIYEGEGLEHEAARLTLRNAIWKRLETPASLDTPPVVRAVDLPRLASALGEITTPRQAKRLEAAAAQSPLIATLIDDVVTKSAGLPREARGSLLQTITADTLGATGVLVAGIVRGEGFSALSATQKAQVAAVLSRLDEAGLTVFAALIEKVPEALTDQDALGSTLLSNLAALATQPLNSAIVGHTTTEELLAGVLTDVMNPNRVEQGGASACTVASMQFELVADDPAEYVRLMAGLASTRGAAVMRGGGELRLGPGDADQRGRASRPVSQALFQSAALEYANGRFANYDPVSGVSISTKTGQPVELKPEHQQALLEKLFGVKYSIDRLFSESDAAKVLARLDGWDARGFQNRPIIVDVDQGRFNHAVTLEAVSGGRVVFRDPFGVLRSMPSDAFPKVAVAVHLPTDVKLGV